MKTTFRKLCSHTSTEVQQQCKHTNLQRRRISDLSAKKIPSVGFFFGGTKHTLLIWTLSCEYRVPYSIGVLLPKDERKVKKTLQNNAALRNESIRSSKYRALH